MLILCPFLLCRLQEGAVVVPLVRGGLGASGLVAQAFQGTGAAYTGAPRQMVWVIPTWCALVVCARRVVEGVFVGAGARWAHAAEAGRSSEHHPLRLHPLPLSSSLSEHPKPHSVRRWHGKVDVDQHCVSPPPTPLYMVTDSTKPRAPAGSGPMSVLTCSDKSALLDVVAQMGSGEVGAAPHATLVWGALRACANDIELAQCMVSSCWDFELTMEMCVLTSVGASDV